MCEPEYMCMYRLSVGTHGSWKRASDSLGLELQTVQVTQCVCCAG